MKFFEEPKITVEKFEAEDVITTSGVEGSGGNGNYGGEIMD